MRPLLANPKLLSCVLFFTLSKKWVHVRFRVLHQLKSTYFKYCDSMMTWVRIWIACSDKLQLMSDKVKRWLPLAIYWTSRVEMDCWILQSISFNSYKWKGIGLLNNFGICSKAWGPNTFCLYTIDLKSCSCDKASITMESSVSSRPQFSKWTRFTIWSFKSLHACASARQWPLESVYDCKNKVLPLILSKSGNTRSLSAMHLLEYSCFGSLPKPECLVAALLY